MRPSKGIYSYNLIIKSVKITFCIKLLIV